MEVLSRRETRIIQVATINIFRWSGLKVRLVGGLMSDRKSYTELEVGETESGSSAFPCPHCGTHLQFKVKTKVVGVYEVALTEEEKKPKRPKTKDPLSPDNRALVETARSAGAIAAFSKALKVDNPATPPNTDKYFITWLKSARRTPSPQFAIRQCLLDGDLDAGGDLELWGYQYVAAVLAGGEFKCFLPMSLIKGKPVASLKVNGNGVEAQNHYSSVDEWIKTKFGYVTGRGLMLTEMRKRAAGSFDTAGL
jgi:hypothetical protein